jgi:hypothetical protein
MVSAGEIEGLPIITAERNVGGGRSPMDDAAKLFALGIEDPDSTGAAGINITLDIYLYTVGTPGSGPPKSVNTRSLCCARVPFGFRSNARISLRRESAM